MMNSVTRFVKDSSGVYRVLLDDGGGMWLISYGSPLAPIFVAEKDRWQFERIPTPADYEGHSDKVISFAQAERMALIRPLLDGGNQAITNKAYRLAEAKRIAEEHDTTPRRVLRLYYRYLATGRLTGKKERAPKSNETYDWAIRTFYFSAKRFSLKATYDMMLVQRYTDANGQLVDGTPTWPSFRGYFYSRNYHKQPKKVIARDGLTHYQRNCRPAFGSATNWRSIPGSYQMDATQADIYLVSRLDRTTVIGRPYIYMAVDTATQLIAGIYIGLEAGEGAVMACLAQAAGDKTTYCQKYGVEIKPEQWPSWGLPSEIITDKGREFLAGRMEELCRRYGIEIQSLPPFRPDGKGLVEKAFDLLQSRYKPLLRGKGVIEADAQERWATDYRAQATLDLHEFTKIIIHCILYLNSGRILRDGKTPAQLWSESVPDLMAVPDEELHLMALPRESVKLSRKGFRLNSLWYVPEDMEGLYLGDTYTLAYDPSDLSRVSIVLEGGYRPCALSTGQEDYLGLSRAEADAQRKKLREHQTAARKREISSSAASIHNIQAVIEDAKQKGGASGSQDGDMIRANRDAERGRLT